MKRSSIMKHQMWNRCLSWQPVLPWYLCGWAYTNHHITTYLGSIKLLFFFIDKDITNTTNIELSCLQSTKTTLMQSPVEVTYDEGVTSVSWWWTRDPNSWFHRRLVNWQCDHILWLHSWRVKEIRVYWCIGNRVDTWKMAE